MIKAKRNPSSVAFQGDTFTPRKKDGYFVSNATKRRLHVAVWESVHGPIPGGWLVHHKDENKDHNEIDNLEAMEWGAHTSHHHLGENLLKLECTYCKLPFQRLAGKLKRVTNPFCSRRCHMLHRNNILGIKQKCDVSMRQRDLRGNFIKIG